MFRLLKKKKRKKTKNYIRRKNGIYACYFHFDGIKMLFAEILLIMVISKMMILDYMTSL